MADQRPLPRCVSRYGAAILVLLALFVVPTRASAQLGCVPADCNDGIACTTDVCNVLTGVCTHLPVNLLCSDNQFCNGTETCSATLGCQAGTAPNCSDSVACTLDTCNETLDLCEHAVSDAACNDGAFCNGAETCNLLLGCQAGLPVACTDTVTCTTDSCNEGTDQCDHIPSDAACDDGLFCTGTETCDETLGCQLGTVETCDDAISCTVDLCNALSDQCEHTPVDATCSDGQYCNGTETCSATLGCQAGSPVNCADSVDCTADSCNETLDICTHSGVDAACSNGLYCDGSETCNLLLGCLPGVPVVCLDAVTCTTDACNEVTDQCDYTPSDAACSDSLFCTGVETCNATLGCQLGTVVTCDDGFACTVDLCNELNDQCDHTGVDALCDDTQFCNGTETCSTTAGCQAGSSPCFPQGCNETLDVCGDCATNTDCNDTLFCNGLESCDAGLGACNAGTAPSCGDTVACTDDSCDENADQCTHTPDHASCSNGVFCDGAEICDETTGCGSGSIVDCVDGVSCTLDMCNESSDSCDHLPSDAACDDGLFCNGEEICNAASGCQAQTPIDCGGLAGCTLGSCDEDIDQCVEENLCCGDSALDAGEDCDPPNVEDCNNDVDDDGNGRRDCIDEDACTDAGNGVITCGDTCNLDTPCQSIRSALAQIRFATSGGPDRLRVRGRFPVTGNVDPVLDGLSLTLANETGEIYHGALQAGDLKVRGTGFSFKDATAKVTGMGIRDGIGSSRVRVVTIRGVVTIKFGMTVYGIFDAANVALMAHQVGMGDNVAFIRAPWTSKTSGWKLKVKKAS